MYFKLSLKNSIINAGMLISCLISCGILFRALFSLGYTHFTKEDVISISAVPLAMSGYIPFACVFPIFPYAFSYLEELNSGYIKSILLRTTKIRYIIHKVFLTGLSGGISMLIPFAIIFGYICLVGQPTDPASDHIVFKDTIWQTYMYIWGGKFVFLCRLLLIFLFGCIWANIALLISVICPNRYVTFLAPFILYQFAWMTFNTDLLIRLNPVYMFRSDFAIGTPLWIPFLIPMGVLIGVCILNILLMNVRIKRDTL